MFSMQFCAYRQVLPSFLGLHAAIQAGRPALPSQPAMPPGSHPSQPARLARPTNPAIVQSGNRAIRQSCNPAIVQSGNRPIWQSCNQAIVQSGNRAIQQSCNLAISQPGRLAKPASRAFWHPSQARHTLGTRRLMLEPKMLIFHWFFKQKWSNGPATMGDGWSIEPLKKPPGPKSDKLFGEKLNVFIVKMIRRKFPKFSYI